MQTFKLKLEKKVLNQTINPSVDVLVFNSSTKPLQVKIKNVFETQIIALCFKIFFKVWV